MTTAQAPAVRPTPILLDCDPGHDDAIAIVMAHRSPAIDLVGVTVTCGNAEIDKTVSNALRVLQFIGAADVPVAAGCRRPLARPLVLGTADGPSGLEGSRICRPPRKLSSHSTPWIFSPRRCGKRPNRCESLQRDRSAILASSC